MLLSTPDVEGFLFETATIAARSTAVATSCGITLRRDGRPLTVGSSDDLAEAVDEAQYQDDQGPCLQALQTGQVVTAPDLAEDDRWPLYAVRALVCGIASSLSLPLLVGGTSVGALNLYSPAARTFEDPAVFGHARSLAAQASVTLAVVLRQTRQADLTDSLQATLVARSVIDQAIGILMGQQRCTADAAFALLRTASQHRNRKLRDVAADVITAATGAPPRPPAFRPPR